MNYSDINKKKQRVKTSCLKLKIKTMKYKNCERLYSMIE